MPIEVKSTRFFPTWGGVPDCKDLFIFGKGKILEVNGNNQNTYAYSYLYELLPSEI
jgi:hypothetical protein